MPIVRADVPDWTAREQMATIRVGLIDCMARTWANDHLWISVRPMYAEPNDTTVILTVDLRDGRGQEAERTQALFDVALQLFGSTIGTTDDKLIVLVRKFEQSECVSGGALLPPLSELTPDLGEWEVVGVPASG